MFRYFIPNENGNPVRVGLVDFVQWKKDNDLHIAERAENGVQVSTVFLGSPYGFEEGRPILWETMIRGGEHSGWSESHTSLDDARRGFDRACALAFKNG